MITDVNVIPVIDIKEVDELMQMLLALERAVD